MSHTLYNTIEQELRTLILDTANNNPAPRLGIIETVAENKCYADIKIGNGLIPSVECFGYPIKGTKCILLFLDGDKYSMLAICNPMNTYYYNGVEDTIETWNLLSNGTFQQYTNNKFKYWTGGSLSTVDSYFGNQTCLLEKGERIISDLIDISSLKGKIIDNDSLMISTFWKGGTIGLEALNKDNKPINFVPSVIGTKEIYESAETWHFQRSHILIEDNQYIRLRYTNLSSKESTLIDGIRIWTPDSNETWYPSKNDKKEGIINVK